MSVMFIMSVWEKGRQSLGLAVAAMWTTTAITNYIGVIMIPAGSVPRLRLNSPDPHRLWN